MQIRPHPAGQARALPSEMARLPRRVWLGPQRSLRPGKGQRQAAVLIGGSLCSYDEIPVRYFRFTDFGMSMRSWSFAATGRARWSLRHWGMVVPRE